MNENFTLHDEDVTGVLDVNNSCAYFPQRKSATETYSIPKYVKITTAQKSIIFEAKTRKAAEGDDIIVSSKNLEKLGGMQTGITPKKVNAVSYWGYSLLHYNLWTFAGFIVALSGVVIDGLLKLGETGIGMECSKEYIIFLKVVSFCLGISGTVILLIKALGKK